MIQSIRRLWVCLCGMGLSMSLSATHLKISQVRPVLQEDLNREAPSVIFDLDWENAWRNSKNHDAIWVFVKWAGFRVAHAKLTSSGHKMLTAAVGSPELDFKVSLDGMGVMISPREPFRGDVSCRVQLFFDTTGQRIGYREMNGLKVFGVEMVYIPQGPFTLGSPDPAAKEKAAFYKSDHSGEPSGLYRIESEEGFKVGPEKDQLYYWSETDLYNGDRQGPVPTAFPKGYNAFYMMKYEVTQGQYADFLNNLGTNDTYLRAPNGGRDYYEHRGTIYLDEQTYVAKDPLRPMNYLSWEDAMAFSDWAGLRPLTELEYTKAARGPGEPIPFEMVWGTDNMQDLMRYVDTEGRLVLKEGFDESQLSDDNRSIYGASYYWVMDLSGSVWEKVITIGNPLGRAFTGNHGDGQLSFGKANVEGWPLSDDEVGGFGYRGGGYYDRSIISDFNPHSPIGHRYYGSWSGGPRYVAYGYRAGRTGW